MLGCCKEEADRERVGVAACVNLQQPQHLRAEGRTGIPEYLGRNWNSRGDFPPGALRKLVLSSYWAPLKTWLNLFLFLPRSTIPYLQPFGPDVLQN